MSAAKVANGPQFLKYFAPVIAALDQLGGSGSKAEIKDTVAQNLGLTEAETGAVNARGTAVYDSTIHWSVWYLKQAGYLVSSKRGVWALTEKSKTEPIDGDAPMRLFREVRLRLGPPMGASPTKTKASPGVNGHAPPEEEQLPPSDEGEPPSVNHRDALLELLRSLPPAGFERICQRLLRESGFQHVEVTGRSGDGGIDGVGILKLNSVLSFKVLFQCKKYAGSVGPGQIRDFRGAMMGRADKGVFLTTGTFTTEAAREAIRDGVPPIELVDAEKLIAMFEELQLGLRPRTIYEIDPEFFREFSAQPATSANSD